MVWSFLHTCRNYSSILFAKELRYNDESFTLVPTSGIEKISNAFLSPLQGRLDYIFKNIYQPAFIVAMNIIGIAAVTMLFYPQQSWHALQIVCSPMFRLETWMIKLGTYVYTESVILALMVRSLARFQNPDLMGAVARREIIPIHLGTIGLPTAER